MNCTVVGSSFFVSKFVFLFSVALIALADNKNVNATLVTTTTTTSTIETETTTVEEYVQDPTRPQGPATAVVSSESTNDHHGGVRGSSSNNYNGNNYIEASKEDVFGSTANSYAVGGIGGASFSQPEEAVGDRDPALFGIIGCEGDEGGGCYFDKCCEGLFCLLKDIGSVYDTWECSKNCKGSKSDLPCKKDDECCNGLMCRKMLDVDYGYCGNKDYGKHGDVCDNSYNGATNYSPFFKCASGLTCYEPHGFVTVEDRESNKSSPQWSSFCQDSTQCKNAGGSCKKGSDCCRGNFCDFTTHSCMGCKNKGESCESTYDCCSGNVCTASEGIVQISVTCQ